MKSKQLGIVIVILSVVVIIMMLSFKIQLDKQQLKACAETCGEMGSDSCTIDSCPFHKGNNNLNWFPILASIMVAGLGGIGLYLSFSKNEKIIEQKEYDLSMLDDDEKRVFNFVKEKPDGVYQSEIVEKLELSKVKVTRILDKLGQRNLIERKRRGMTNIVLLR